MVFEAATQNILWTVLVVIGAAVVAVSIAIAKYLYRKGELTIRAKRRAFLDPKEIRLELSFSNEERSTKELHQLGLAEEVDGKLVEVDHINVMPIERGDVTSSFIRKDENGYYFHIPRGHRHAAVVCFHVDHVLRPITYLIGYDKKGKPVRAKIVLNYQHTQYLEFKRYRKKKR